jgi:hypothetical protein
MSTPPKRSLAPLIRENGLPIRSARLHGFERVAQPLPERARRLLEHGGDAERPGEDLGVVASPRRVDRPRELLRRPLEAAARHEQRGTHVPQAQQRAESVHLEPEVRAAARPVDRRVGQCERFGEAPRTHPRIHGIDVLQREAQALVGHGVDGPCRFVGVSQVVGDVAGDVDAAAADEEERVPAGVTRPAGCVIGGAPERGGDLREGGGGVSVITRLISPRLAVVVQTNLLNEVHYPSSVVLQFWALRRRGGRGRAW